MAVSFVFNPFTGNFDAVNNPISAPTYIELHAWAGYTGAVSNGSYNQPYTSVQAAVNAAAVIGAANITIFLHGPSFTENVTINTNAGLLIESFGSTAVDSQIVLIIGNVSIVGSSTRIRLKDIKIAYPGGTQPDLIDSSQGRNYFSNVDFGGGGGISFTGSWARWHEFTDCTINGNISIAGTPSAGSTVSTWRVRGGGNFLLNSANVTLQLYDSFNVGNVTHSAGNLLIDGGRNFTSGSTITSTATTPAVFEISNCDLQNPGTNTFIGINKTGNCNYAISNVWRNEATDVLTGTRIVYGATSADMSYLPTTSANWPVPPTNVKQALDDLAIPLNSTALSFAGFSASGYLSSIPNWAFATPSGNAIANATLQVNTLSLAGATSGIISIGAAAATTPYSILMPPTQGAALTFLQNDGAGNLAWAAGSAAAPTWASVYLNTTITTYTNATPVVYDTVLVDTNSSYNTGTGEYTVPSSGQYLVTICHKMAISTSATNDNITVQSSIWKNGANVNNIGQVNIDALATSGTYIESVTGSAVMSCTAGDIITGRAAFSTNVGPIGTHSIIGASQVFNTYLQIFKLPSTGGGGGSGSAPIITNITLSGTDITNAGVILPVVPAVPSNVSVNVVGGVQQQYSVDFTINSNLSPNKTLDWTGLGLDGILTAGDVLTVIYNQ